MTISGARNHHYGSILFLAPEIVKMGRFLAPEIVNLIKRSYIDHAVDDLQFLLTKVRQAFCPHPANIHRMFTELKCELKFTVYGC